MRSNFLLSGLFETSKYPNLYKQRDNFVARLGLDKKIQVHNGCINTLSWSDTNCSYLLSGSDDLHLMITNAFTGSLKTSILTGHRANIFSAKFLPRSNDERLISCSADGSIQLTDTNYTEQVNSEHLFACHGSKTCYELHTFPQDPSIFVSCGQDGTCKWIDLRQSSKCTKSNCQEHTLLKLSTGISAIAINPFVPYHLASAGLDGIVRFFDRRMLSVGSHDMPETIMSLADQSTRGLFATFGINSSGSSSPTSSHACNIPGNTVTSNKRITSLQYDNWGAQLLVSYQTDNIYLLDWRDLSMENKNDPFIMQPNILDSTLPDSDNPGTDLPPDRKFRIQTDWSDTGPNSHPIGLSSTPDPRTFLMSRLNDWFSDLYQNRTSSSQSSSSSSNSSISNSTSNSVNNSSANNSSTTNGDSEIGEPNYQRSEINSGNNTIPDFKTIRPNLSAQTSNLMCSRIRSKQAMKLENNCIKKQPSPKLRMVYTGHRNARTIIKECNFWGDDHIVSGSDCGHIFFWNKHTGKIVNVIEADNRVVNCVQENPLYPVLASSGIDYDIKVWQPILENPVNIDEKIDRIIEKNKLMLDENRKTIFIPVQFMVPALRLFGANMRGGSNSNVNGQSTDIQATNNDE